MREEVVCGSNKGVVSIEATPFYFLDFLLA